MNSFEFDMKTSRMILLLSLMIAFSIPFAFAGRVEKAYVCTGLDAQNQPTGIETVFSTEAEQLVIWAEFSDLSGGDELQFDLVVPGEETVYISATKGLASSAATHVAWQVIPLTNYALQPGQYVANVYLNGMSAMQISIQLAGGTTPPIPYMIMNGIDAPEQVTPGEKFTISVYTEYHFASPTQVTPTIYDPMTESVIAATSETLDYKGQRGFTFDVIAPEGSGEYFLYAVNYFDAGGELTFNENGGIQTIVLQLGQGGTGSTLPIDPSEIKEIIPDDISLEDLANLIPDNLNIDLSDLEFPDSVNDGIEKVEEVAKNNGVPGYSVEVIVLALVAVLYYLRLK